MQQYATVPHVYFLVPAPCTVVVFTTLAALESISVATTKQRNQKINSINILRKFANRDTY